MFKEIIKITGILTAWFIILETTKYFLVRE